MGHCMRPASSSTETGFVPPSRPARWWRWARVLPLVGCSALVAYLQFRSDPSLPPVPKPLGGVRDYFDLHDFSKNAFGFAVLALTMHLAFDRPDVGRATLRTALLAVVIVLLELAQIPLPARTCDWRDIAAGWLGIVLVDLAWRATHRLRHGC